MKKIGLLVFLLLWAMPAAAQQLQVVELVVTTDIIDRSPVDALESYSSDVGRLYCFSRILGAEDETRVTHVWWRGTQEMGRITLPVRSPDWRTWSSKSVLPEWDGEWKVEVLDEQGNLLSSATFVLL